MNTFFILAVLLTIQSLWSLRGGFQFLDFVRRSLKRSPALYHPPAAVIIPCKGRDEDLECNAVKFLAQNYPYYELIFVVASESDPAYSYLAALIAQNREALANRGAKCRLVVARYSNSNGEKVNNLLAGLKTVDPEAEVLVFADIDASPREEWLRTLVDPLQDPSITISTGFRWYLPGADFTSRLRSAWDSSIATMLGEHKHNLAWGGSMAIRAETFKRLQIAEKYWQNTVSDDYAIARAVREAGGSIRFEPRCLIASHSSISFREFLRWTNRQIIITRVYHPRYWKLGIASYGIYALTLIWGLVLILLPGGGAHRIAAAVFLAVILGLGMTKGALRAGAAREVFPEEKETVGRYSACYWQLAPLVPWVMLFNFISAGFIRRIEWSGTIYELRSMTELKVIRREN